MYTTKCHWLDRNAGLLFRHTAYSGVTLAPTWYLLVIQSLCTNQDHNKRRFDSALENFLFGFVFARRSPCSKRQAFIYLCPFGLRSSITEWWLIRNLFMQLFELSVHGLTSWFGIIVDFVCNKFVFFFFCFVYFFSLIFLFCLSVFLFSFFLFFLFCFVLKHVFWISWSVRKRKKSSCGSRTIIKGYLFFLFVSFCFVLICSVLFGSLGALNSHWGRAISLTLLELVTHLFVCLLERC